MRKSGRPQEYDRRVNLMMTDELVESIDAARGMAPRSAWIRSAIEQGTQIGLIDEETRQAIAQVAAEYDVTPESIVRRAVMAHLPERFEG